MRERERSPSVLINHRHVPWLQAVGGASNCDYPAGAGFWVREGLGPVEAGKLADLTIIVVIPSLTSTTWSR
jgi:hypothetical protein